MLASLLFLLAAAEPLTTVAAVDLNRYAGTWYEAARTPNRYQKKCVGSVRATYSLESPEKLRVVNECRLENGKMNSVKGSAKVAGSTAKLKVTFFWPFYGDYWILDLDPEYRWVVIGEPKRENLWIMTREPDPSDELMRKLAAIAKDKGYDTTKLVRTPK